jgi:hypothetical protein
MDGSVVSKIHILEISYLTPFVDETWAGYWLSAEREYRINKKLFLEAMTRKFPELFSLPSKSTLGLLANAKTRYQVRRSYHFVKRVIQKRVPRLSIRSSIENNYVDYDEMFHKRKDYRESLSTAFDYLRSEQITPWLDLDQLWSEHMKHRKCHGNAFCVLIGLAANLISNPIEI